MGAPIEIHVIADSTGDTAGRVARATAAQFTGHATTVVRHVRVTTAARVDAVLGQVERSRRGRDVGVVVLYTLVDDELRELVAGRCDELRLPHCDLLGPALAAFEAATGERAQRVAARPVGAKPDYLRRFAAVKYAIRHDDGQHLDALADADIVLVGVSRSGKTPLSVYLGYLGYNTVNIPLVRGIPAPAALADVPRWKVVGLTIAADRLAAIRRRRLTALGTGVDRGGYSQLDLITEELEEAAATFRRLGCPVVDTTDLALEEVAGRVIDIVADRHRAAAPASLGSVGDGPPAAGRSLATATAPK